MATTLSPAALLRTPLYQFHIDHGAKMVDFAGWEMPMLYARPGGGGGIVEEHNAVRTSGGLFDVSHMGRLKITGLHAAAFLERVCTRRIRDMKVGQCRYALVCNESGGVMDDVIVYRIDEDDFLVVVNASNREKIVSHFKRVMAAESRKVKMDDQTMSTTMVALQGPKVVEFVGKFSREIPTLKRYSFAVKNLLIVKLYVSRTGYTGEDGVEVILPAAMTGMAMKMILKDADPKDPNSIIKPAGLGARDTLRMEAGMPLYGHELNEETSALAAGLDFAIALDKDTGERPEPFIGLDALKRTRDAGGPARRLVGLRLEGKRSARQGMGVLVDGKSAGTVTSACPSPTLGCSIAMAYLEKEKVAEGTKVEVDTGKGERIAGEVVKLPFYKVKKG
ncbi:glycine cleavage system aminomethyltransferase GcvT [soil metagenome]